MKQNHIYAEEFSSWHLLCSILTFDPTKHAIPKMAEVHTPLAWASLADNIGQG